MSRDQKIISLNGGEFRRAGAGPAAPSIVPAPLLPVRDHALKFLKVALGDLFDNADDTLFEMADRAGSNTEQTLFFEAMRTMRLQRHLVTRSCHEGLVKALEAVNQSARDHEPAHTSFEVDSLSLVQPDELEQSVALDGMVGRALTRNRLPLTHLATRMNSLVKEHVDDDTNPFAPATLAQIFLDSVASMELDIKVRLIVLKLYERYVFNRLDGLYHEANELLIAAGVMPDLKLTPTAGRPQRGGQAAGREVAPSGQGPAIATANAASDANHQQVLSLFSELIGGWRHASGDTALTRLGSPGGAPMASNELLGMLAQLPLDESAPFLTARELRSRIQHSLAEQRRQTGEARSLARMDDDVISLVAMLFDFILDDKNLPAALKALIGRLQLPVLRVAIVDKSFFSLSSHPARKLLNELARATLGWNDQDDLTRDQLHGLLEGLVNRLLSDTHPQAELFETVHAELAEFLKVEHRRASRFEQRTRDAEEGRAKVEAARNKVAMSLNELLVGKTLPVLVIDAMRDTWSQVMQMVWLREGEDSQAWHQVVATAQELVQSMLSDGGYSPEHQARVLVDIKAGLELIGQDEQQSAPLINGFAELQKAASARVQDVTSTVVAPDAKRADLAGSPEAESQPTVVDLTDIPAAAEVVEPAYESVHVAEPILEAAVEETEELITDLPSINAATWVANLHTGGWFDLSMSPEAPAQRCKLAAIISFSGKYIFVNRSGMKVAEFAKTALYQHFDNGLIRLVDDNQLFDRALESVIGNLRKLQSSKT